MSTAGDLANPGMITRFVAGRRKEMSTVQLEAYRRAGSAVFDLHLVADARRRELAAAGMALPELVDGYRTSTRRPLARARRRD